VPKQFSWLDQRLVRDHYIDRCTHPAATLYLFLVTVADVQGLSYYSDRSISQRLNMDNNILAQARQELSSIGLIAYKHPLYQILAIEERCRPSATPAIRRSSSHMQSLKQIFNRLGEGAP
jgi:replication initiation and membrane attachment protein DnaB